jgi:hypothetical protein
MPKSTNPMREVLPLLARRARARELTASAWAERAGIRKETLSRLSKRANCDFATLCSLARAVDARLGVLDEAGRATTPDGHFPAQLDRDYEEQLVELCATRHLDPARWAAAGPQFFVAGLAVMVASLSRTDRRGLLALAEQLHPGASEVAVFDRWLERSPVRPSRFLPLLEARLAHAA